MYRRGRLRRFRPARQRRLGQPWICFASARPSLAARCADQADESLDVRLDRADGLQGFDWSVPMTVPAAPAAAGISDREARCNRRVVVSVNPDVWSNDRAEVGFHIN